MKFKIGDKVEVTKEYDAAMQGMVGHIVNLEGSPENLQNRAGIEFGKPFKSGHDCGSHGKPRCCQYVPFDHIKMVYKKWNNLRKLIL